MKVNGSHPHTQVDRVSHPATRETRKHEQTPAAPASGEQVRVSNVGRALASARAPEEPDEKRIAELRAMVQSGRLPIDPHAIASKMVDEER